MTCDELLRRLAEWEDGVLPADLCIALQSHLADCPPCAELRDELRQLSSMCRQAPRPEMPEALRWKLRRLLGGPA